MKRALFNGRLILPFLLITTNIHATTYAATVDGKWPEPEITPPTQPQVIQQPNVQTQAVNQVQNKVSNPTQQQKRNDKVAAYLGLGVDILPESVIAQLPAGASTGEGIIITRFAADSPAKKSGLQAHDILLAYDNIKIIHPKQFINLVRKDQPGRVVQLKVLRNGKLISHPVTLGMQEIPQIPDGLVIKQLGEKYYQATIRFTDANGKKQLRQYKGTREQIYYQALNARDLPEKDRQQILYAAGGPNRNQSNNKWGAFFPFGNRGNNKGGNSWGSFFPFGSNNGNHNGNNNRFGSFFPFNR